MEIKNNAHIFEDFSLRRYLLNKGIIMTFYIHMGTPKTATTSLQHSFDISKDEIMKTGLLWLGGHPHAHAIASSLLGTTKSINSQEYHLKKRTIRFQNNLAELIRSSNAQNFLFSSEYLYDFSHEEVGVFSKILKEICPIDTDYRVICYVRDPIGFATSECQEGIKSGKFGLDEFYENPWRRSQSSIIGSFRDVFGPDAVDVRYFNKNMLKKGDIFSDFMDAISVDENTFPLKKINKNFSLSYEGVQVANALQTIRPKDKRHPRLRRKYKLALRNIAGAKFQLPIFVQKRILERSKLDMDQINEWYNLGINQTDLLPVDIQDYDEAKAMELAMAIDKKVQGI